MGKNKFISSTYSYVSKEMLKICKIVPGGKTMSYIQTSDPLIPCCGIHICRCRTSTPCQLLISSRCSVMDGTRCHRDLMLFRIRLNLSWIIFAVSGFFHLLEKSEICSGLTVFPLLSSWN